MRTYITALIIALAFMNVAAKVHGQKVSISAKGTSLQKVILEIKKQTGYQFWYEDDLLKNSKPITLTLNNATLVEALDAVIEGQPLSYTISDRTVVLKAKVKGFLQRVLESFKLININGKVADDNGQPLSGATIKVKGMNRQTSTNRNGEFYLENVAEDAIIEISFVGYVTQEIKAKATISVQLLSAQNELQEVTINKGYYRTTKELNTGSVGTVTSESLSRQPVGDPILALHGQVPGLYLAQQQGNPGTPTTVRIRGTNSIANGNDPLYIIDGVPFSSETASGYNVTGAAFGISPFSTLGMENIESIDVLKDADATAIYGSRGANGVILITTKKGKAGRTLVSANFNRGFGRIANGYDLMNTEQYLQMRREAFANDARTPIATSYDVNGTFDPNSYTDWEKVMIGGTAHLTNATASISGGNDLTQFLISGGYRNETSVYPGSYRDRKITLQSNISNRSPNGKLNTSLTLMYSNDNNLLPTTDFTQRVVLAPNAPAIYNADGSLNWANGTWTNPFASLNNSSTSEIQNLNGAFNGSYQIIPGLTVSARMGYNKINGETHNILPLSAKNPASAVTANSRTHNVGFKRTNSWIIEPALNYSTVFRWLKFDGVIGGTFQDTSYDGLSLSAVGFTSDDLMDDLNAASSINPTASTFGKYRYSAIYSRLGFTIRGKYVINLTGRRDGSSRFASGKQFGNFGAIGAAWLFQKEEAIKNALPFLSFGKLRASYGVTGNDQFADYKYLSTYSSGVTYQGIAGLAPTQHTSSEFGWETVNKLEFTLELGFKNIIDFNIGWFRNRTANQLVGYPLPAMTGFTSVQANLPAIVQNAGWEADISARIFSSDKVKWNISANITIPKNKLVSYPNLAASSYASRLVIGMPITVIQRYHFTGVDSQSGLYTFTDKNGDNAITSAQDRFPLFVGQKLFSGLTNNFSYKGFEVSFLLQYVKQNGSETRPITIPGFFFTNEGNLPRGYVDRWRKPGDIARYQKVTQVSGSPAANAAALFNESDGLIVDKSFLRLRNVSLAWNMPKEFSRKIGMTNFKVFVNAQNLLTITPYKGNDPEMTAGNYALPTMRMITSGLQVAFN